MTADIFDRLALSPEAVAVRQALSVSALGSLAKALEEFVMVSDRPIRELADRLLCGYADVMTGGDSRRLTDLIVDVLTDDDTTTTH